MRSFTLKPFCFRFPLGWLLAVLALPAGAAAHPVPRQAHDRIIVVRLEPRRLVVTYRLDIDPLTVLLDDLPAVDDQVDTKALQKPDAFYDAFTRVYAPILAGNLTAKLDHRPLTLRCSRHSHTLRDENGQPLDHLRCDFVFETEWNPAPDAGHPFELREGNYDLEVGFVRLSLEAVGGLEIQKRSQADRALQDRPERDLKPGDAERLRTVSALFSVAAGQPPPAPTVSVVETMPSPEDHDHGLLDLLFDTERGLWLLLLIATGFGAAHALTPGHGKTLVAAYLVGERGTVAHAVLLGIATTVSHTGVVILAALLLTIWRINIEHGLQLISGLIVTGLGFWLFLRRLSGGHDHLHLGGHSHGHGLAHSHGHGNFEHVHGAAAAPSIWGVVMLGIAGGIVPCWDAIFLLGVALSKQMTWLALPLVLAFSAGLAATLVAIGVTVVYVKGFSDSRWGQGRIIKMLPPLSAALIFGMGLWMCYRSSR